VVVWMSGCETVGERRFPCLDGHRYEGCVGLELCSAERCWNGRRLRSSGLVRADAFDKPPRVQGYVGSGCGNCRHAVDLQVDGELRSAGGRRIGRWTICDLDLWEGPASLYNLINHRAPMKVPGPCPSFVDTPSELMRPEIVRHRQVDRERSQARRLRRRRTPSPEQPRGGSLQDTQDRLRLRQRIDRDEETQRDTRSSAAGADRAA